MLTHPSRAHGYIHLGYTGLDGASSNDGSVRCPSHGMARSRHGPARPGPARPGRPAACVFPSLPGEGRGGEVEGVDDCVCAGGGMVGWVVREGSMGWGRCGQVVRARLSSESTGLCCLACRRPGPVPAAVATGWQRCRHGPPGRHRRAKLRAMCSPSPCREQGGGLRCRSSRRRTVQQK